LGGAPANFAYHARALGAFAQVITPVGNDRFGREIFEVFRKIDLPDAMIQIDAEAPTGTVAVTRRPSHTPQR
jgi:fructokinase